jgi:PAS domain S-box-containing protein
MASQNPAFDRAPHGTASLQSALYDRVIENSADLISIVDRDYVYRMVNSAHRERYEKTGEETVGKHAAEILGGTVFEGVVRPKLERCFNGQTVRCRDWYEYADLGKRYMDVSYYPLPDGDDSVGCVAVVARDITEHKNAEDGLRDSESRYRLLAENIKDVIWTMDPYTMQFTYISPSVTSLRGYTAEEALALGLDKTLTPAAYEEAAEKIATELSPENIERGNVQESYTLELEEICKDGSTVCTEETATILFDSSGKPTEVLGVTRNITDRKRAEQSLRESEERYHRTLDASHDMILVLDAEANILFANRSWHENASYTFDEIHKMDIFNTIHPDDRDKAKDFFEKALFGQSARNIEYRSLTREGEPRWFETNADPIDWPGAERAIVIMAREVTQRKRAEEALERSLSLVGATLDATADGIVAINMNGEIVSFNEKFMKIFQLPEFALASGESQIAAGYIIDQMKDPGGFFEKVRQSYERPDLEVFDILEFKDGRIVERYIKPQKVNDEIVGGVLSFRDITRRRQTEEALRKSEEKYRSIFWEAPDIFYTLDLETWVITDANKYALEALEYGPEMLGKLHVSDIIHPEDFERATNRLRDLVTQKDRTPNYPVRIVTRTGKTLHIEQSGVIFWDEQGNARTFLGLAHDVTYRTQQDKMIQKRNERIAVLYEVAKAANETLDLEKLVELMLKVVPQVTNSKAMAIFSLNRETQQFDYLAHYGISRESVEGTNHLGPDEGIHGYIIEHQKPLLIKNLKEHPLLTRAAHVGEMEIEGAIAAPLILENEVIGFLWVARAPGNPYDEDDLELVSAMANHIAIAIANARLYARVRERETRLQSILETSRDGIAVFSSDRHATYRNRAIAAMFGYDETDVIFDMNTESFFHSESLHVLEDVRERLARGEEIREIFRFKGMRKDGGTFDAEARLGNFFERGKRYGVAIVRDVTERNRLRFQLEQSGKLAAIGELAAGVAHEINNPIATLDVQTGLMRDILGDERERLSGPFFDHVDEYLDIVENQIQRCQSVTNDLLSFSRSPKGKMEACAINSLLERTIRLVSSLTDKKPKLQLRLDERLPPFFGDPNRLEQVFVNLLNNALKAIQSGGSITVATRVASNNDICVKFKDTGPGMEPEIGARIFDPFFTTDAAGGGTGLGLSISYYIIKEMNGTIDVESYPGKGATFTVTLPSGNRDERSTGNG